MTGTGLGPIWDMEPRRTWPGYGSGVRRKVIVGRLRLLLLLLLLQKGPWVTFEKGLFL